jgi:hypothetical protein
MKQGTFEGQNPWCHSLNLSGFSAKKQKAHTLKYVPGGVRPALLLPLQNYLFVKLVPRSDHFSLTHFGLGWLSRWVLSLCSLHSWSAAGKVSSHLAISLNALASIAGLFTNTMLAPRIRWSVNILASPCGLRATESTLRINPATGSSTLNVLSTSFRVCKPLDWLGTSGMDFRGCFVFFLFISSPD